MKTDDLLHFEEQLKTTLHSDDKEKLRRKLAELQREYLRTAQRLQRAERLDAVRRHVRSGIPQQNQPDPEVRAEPSSVILKGSDGNDSHVPDCQEPPRCAADVDNQTKSHSIQFGLPSDPACPQTPDPNPVTQSSLRPRSAVRLRSRRSRLRMEGRSAEVGRSKDHFKKTQNLSNTVEHDGTTAEEEEKVKQEGVDVMHESEVLFSSAESEPRSLLLTHWNIHEHTDTENVAGITMCQGKETQLRPDHQNEPDIHSPLLTSTSPLNHTAEKRNDTTENISSKVDGKEEDVNFGGAVDLKHQENSHTADKVKSDQNSEDILTTKEKTNEMTREDKGSTRQESCTIVDGLLFPAEYYVRTTRRMSYSQTQPDLQAVILSQLNPRQHCKRRSRGRGQCKSIAEHSDCHNWTDLPSQKTASSSNVQNDSFQSSGEKVDLTLTSHMDSEGLLSSSIISGSPTRGRKKRSRGRRRFQTPRSTNITASISPCSSAAATHSVTQNNTFLASEEARPAHSQSIDSQLPSVGIKTLSTSVSGEIEDVFPIFKKKDVKTAKCPQKDRGSASWHSFILPSSSPSPTSLSPLLPVKGLSTLSIQDFHLPDEQFASLKLQKLQNVAMELGIEHFSSPSCNTRSSYQRSSPQCFTVNGLMTFSPLPLSPTPTASSLHIQEDHQDAAMSANLHKTSREHKHTDECINQPSTESDVIENLHEEAHSNMLCSVSGVQVGAGIDCVLAEKEDEAQALYLKSDSFTTSNNEAPLKSDQVNYYGEEQTSEEAFSCDHLLRDRPKEPANTSAFLQTTGSSGECLSHLTVTSAEVSKQPSKADSEPLAGGMTEENKPRLDTQLLISPPVSIPCHFITPHHPSSTLTSSPALPSLGITPHPDPVSFPLTSSPSPPPLSLPPSPSGLSQCPSLSQLDVALQASPTTKEAAEGFKTHISHTLKAAAGGPLVDACCFIGPSGTLCVAAAGKWAVCLWSQTSTSDWSLKHTWTFNKPVVNVFPVPDTAGLMCVTLGQLEIREVRMLSSSNFMQKLICEGVLQVVIGLSESRVVTSSPSAAGSTLQVFMLSDSSGLPSSHSLASPGVCVGALAPVDGLSDGLLGTDESGHLFVWNLKSGKLLCRVLFGEDLLHTACLRGYSHCGVLFVLLQHHFLSSLDKKEEEKMLNKETKDILFSLVAVNPMSGKSFLATCLYPPTDWTDSLCEVDVNCTGVVGLSQSGCICVWGLGRLGAPQMLKAPVSDGWQLARWGEADTLVTGHLNGDITLHRCN